MEQDIKLLLVGNINGGGYESRNRVYNPAGISPTILCRLNGDGVLILDVKRKNKDKSE
jgi:hypothetical protein